MEPIINKTNWVRLVALTALLFAYPLRGDDEGLLVEPVDGDRTVSFSEDVLPALQRSCFACHNESETEGELILETVESIGEGGDSGPAIVPGNAEESLLFQLAAHRTDPIMPPVDNDVGAKPLSAKALGMLAAWINQGAKPDEEPKTEETIQWKKVPDRYAPVFAMELSPDGRWLAAARGNELLVYSVPGKRLTWRLVDESIKETHPDSAHLDIVQSVAWSPDQRTIVSGGYRCIKVWQAEAEPSTVSGAEADAGQSGDAPATFEPGDAFVTAVDWCVSPDGTRAVVIAEKDGTNMASLVELPTRKVLRTVAPSELIADEVERQDRRVVLGSERLRVARDDAETAKKRHEEEIQNEKKNREELKKAKDAVPKAKEVAEKAAGDAAKKREELEKLEEQLTETKKQLEGLSEATEDEPKKKETRRFDSGTGQEYRCEKKGSRGCCEKREKEAAGVRRQGKGGRAHRAGHRTCPESRSVA